LLREAGLVLDGWDGSSLAGESGLVLPEDAGYGRHIYNQFVIRTDRRDELMAYLMDCKIGTEVYYPVPMHLQECFAELGYKRGDLPASERAADETLALPIYPELNLEMIGTVVKGSFDFIKYGGMEADSQRLVSPTEAAWEEGRYKDCRRTVFPVFPHNTVT